MIELPESQTLARQIQQMLQGRRVTEVYGPTHAHKFTFFNEEISRFREMLVGKRLLAAVGMGIFVDMPFEEEVFLSVSDGIGPRYGQVGAALPAKYQMLITFDDESFVYFNTRMYGGIAVFRHTFDNKYHRLNKESLSPLSEAYDEAYFAALLAAQKPSISLKALLATEQRIPGVGNGVLQDILFEAGLRPKRKLLSLSEADNHRLFGALKAILRQMTEGGGRDTETDFLGHAGGYPVVLSQYSYASPCPRCGDAICKEAFMGGLVYYCPDCQH